MGAVKDTWLSALETIEALGKDRASKGLGALPDYQLWANARAYTPDGLLPVEPDAALLAELRDAYTAGEKNRGDAEPAEVTRLRKLTRQQAAEWSEERQDATARIEALKVRNEWTHTTAAAYAKALEGSHLETLLAALAQELAARQNISVVDIVRTTLADQYLPEDVANIVGVIFRTDEWDNGIFLDHDSATVYFADGTTDMVDFPVQDELTAGYGKVGPNAALAVRLADGKTEFADQISAAWYWLGFKQQN